MHRLMRLTALALTVVLAFAAQAATETYDDIGFRLACPAEAVK